MKRAFTRLELVVVLSIIAMLLTCMGCFIPVQILIAPVFFLYKTVPDMGLEWAAIAAGAVSLFLLIGTVHSLAGWLYRSSKAAAEGGRWRLGWTLSGVFGSLFVVTASIAMIGTVHELGWLLTSDEPVIGGMSEAPRRAQSSNNLKQLALGCENYHDAMHRLPPGGTFDRYGEPLHSWETHLLPYIEQGNIKPNIALRWDHPDNAKHFRTGISTLNHPAFGKDEDRISPEGLALSHYAANRHVMRDNFSIRQEDAADGVSNTILIGEVGMNFKPWGDPVNWRDPALGINRSPDGFGGPPKYPGSQFTFVDGRVQFFAQDTDPEVLKALATPSGGEEVPMPH